MGIDPGKNGGIAVLWGAKNIEAYRYKTPIEMANVVNHILNNCYMERYNPYVFLERVHAMPTDARSSAFAFVTNYGIWQGILATHKIEPILVNPFVWQRKLLKRYKLPKDYRQKKNKLKSIAQKFVDFKVTLATADCILIAKYGNLKGVINET